uniref:apolipoprotein C-II n=1 Tax=Scatophagus argus TaxID=75038 RepID=UPI001ED8162F|nr:apolipoprotein C-II [Scatophagus argus]
MNKLLVVTVLVALLASAESFRVLRQAEEEEQGTVTKITSAARSYYNKAVNTASEYLESAKGLKLEEKAKNFYSDATTIMGTYLGIMQDQVYHFFSTQ